MKLKEIEITAITGEKQKIEFDYKGLANYIFSKTKDIGELELARGIVLICINVGEVWHLREI